MTVPELRESAIAIIGTGLMGASLGRALAGSCRVRLGADADASHAAAAVSVGAIDEAGPLEEVLASADVVVLAMPVGTIVAAVPHVAGCMRPGALLTDIGSTKQAICDALDAAPGSVRSIGGHPMCGREQGGAEAADPGIFDRARWVLSPTSGTDEHALTLATQLARATGATPLVVERGAHDRAVAVTSHLPYVAAQSLVGVAASADAPDLPLVRQLAASGWRDTTRLAAGEVDMWSDILTTNSANVRGTIERMRVQLDRLDCALEDPRALRELLLDGQQARRRSS